MSRILVGAPVGKAETMVAVFARLAVLLPAMVTGELVLPAIVTFGLALTTFTPLASNFRAPSPVPTCMKLPD
uniref:Putative secreted protein n=1 Tax=Anopheles darlingi TaxID=43151 RepID=A0A2M4DR05_ANODA